MAFELFKDLGARTKEYISITENKTFGLPRTFVAKRGITTGHRVVLFYDADAKKIALHFTTGDTKYGLKVRLPSDKAGAIIIAGSFFDVKGIDTTKYSGRYSDFETAQLRDLGVNANGEAYVITLKEKSAKLDEPENAEPTAAPDDKPINLDDIPF